jgi:hypothetical protein
VLSNPVLLVFSANAKLVRVSNLMTISVRENAENIACVAIKIGLVSPLAELLYHVLAVCYPWAIQAIMQSDKKMLETFKEEKSILSLFHVGEGASLRRETATIIRFKSCDCTLNTSKYLAVPKRVLIVSCSHTLFYVVWASAALGYWA